MRSDSPNRARIRGPHVDAPRTRHDRRSNSLDASLRCIAVTLFISSVVGCDKPTPASPSAAATQPATAPVTQPAPPPPRSPILPESIDWSLETARARLAADDSDDDTRLSAAVRLVRLSDLQPAALPDPLAQRVAARLRLLKIGQAGWALGYVCPDPNRLASPVFLSPAGDVSSPLDGAEDEVSQLVRSEDEDRFPHVLVTPVRILVVGESVRAAIVARELQGARLECRAEDGTPVLAVVMPPVSANSAPATAASAPIAEPDSGSPEAKVIATYHWDPLELAFVGPASDRLPDPPGGFFELDLEQCEALVPVGGELKPVETPPPAKKRPEATEPPEY